MDGESGLGWVSEWVGGTREEDALFAYLRVLVDEHEGIGHVSVPQVHHGEAHPGPALPLDGMQDAGKVGEWVDGWVGGWVGR